MRAINHALTGAIIGVVVREPVIAVPAALASHFICDMIPHYDTVLTGANKRKWIGSKEFSYLLYFDAVLCISLVLILAIRHPAYWLLAAVCAFVATSPDLLFMRRYLRARHNKNSKLGQLVKLTIKIQWFQRPIGAVVEVAWFMAALIILIPFLR
jgi:hypothetical protein